MQIVTTNHLKSVREGSSHAGFPYVIGGILKDDLSCEHVCAAVVTVYGWMPILGFVLHDIARVVRVGNGSQELVAVILRMREESGSVVGVNMLWRQEKKGDAQAW